MKFMTIIFLITCCQNAYADKNLGLGISWGYGVQNRKILNSEISTDYLGANSFEYKNTYPIFPAIEMHINSIELGLALDEFASSKEKEQYGGRLFLFLRLLKFDLYKFRIKKIDCKLNLLISPGLGVSFFLAQRKDVSEHALMSFTGMLRLGPELAFGPIHLRISARGHIEYGLGYFNDKQEDTIAVLHMRSIGIGVEGGVIFYVF